MLKPILCAAGVLESPVAARTRSARAGGVYEGLPRLRAALKALDGAYKLELVTAAALPYLVCYMPLANYQ